MYNDKKSSFSPDLHRDLPPRVPIGRSCPTFAQNGGQLSDLPHLDERQGGRLCDGSLPGDALSSPSKGRIAGRNTDDFSRRNCRNDEHGNGDCGNGLGGWGLNSHPLAMVYSPLQEFRDLYDVDVALGRGTIFAELDLPFEGKMSGKGGCKLC